MPSYISREVLDTRAFVLRELGQVSTPVGAEDALIGRLRKIVPFEACVFSGLDIEGCEVGAGVYLASSLPEAMIRAYTHENYIEVDPLVHLLSETRPVASWEDIEPGGFASRRGERLYKLLRDNDAVHRTTFALWNRDRCYGAATLIRKKAFSADETGTLKMFVPVVHGSLSKPLVDAVNERLGLSKGEVMCLRLGSQGLSSDEIAEISPYTADTVTTYLKSAIRKLGAKNRTQAIVEAMRRRIID